MRRNVRCKPLLMVPCDLLLVIKAEGAKRFTFFSFSLLERSLIPYQQLGPSKYWPVDSIHREYEVKRFSSSAESLDEQNSREDMSWHQPTTRCKELYFSSLETLVYWVKLNSTNCLVLVKLSAKIADSVSLIVKLQDTCFFQNTFFMFKVLLKPIESFPLSLHCDVRIVGETK